MKKWRIRPMTDIRVAPPFLPTWFVIDRPDGNITYYWWGTIAEAMTWIRRKYENGWGSVEAPNKGDKL